MRWWKWAIMALMAVAFLALAAVWGLREADVIRWGAVGAALDRIDTLKERNAALEDRTGILEQTEDHFIVVSTGYKRGNPADFCITYTAPGGPQETCRSVSFDDGGLAEHSQHVFECWESAVLGEPLPACWR